MYVQYKVISIRSDISVATIMEALGHGDPEKWNEITDLIITSSRFQIVLTDVLLEKIAQ